MISELLEAFDRGEIREVCLSWLLELHTQVYWETIKREE